MPQLLPYIPIQTNYSAELMPGSVVEVPLAGGLSRKRADVLYPGHVVECTWIVVKEEYEKFLGFFRTDLKSGSQSFLLDVITDIGVPIRHVARNIGGPPKLIRQSGDAYWIQATLQCNVNPTVTDYITYQKASNSWVFDGVNDQISFGDILDKNRTDAFSMFVWYMTTDSSPGVAIAKQSAASAIGWRMVVNSSLGEDFIIDNGSGGKIRTGANIPIPTDGNLHFFGLTYSGNSNASGIQFYVDNSIPGQTILENDLSFGSTTNSEPLQIGLRGTTIGFNGELYHISIWGKALTPAEVSGVYNGGTFPDLSLHSAASFLQLWVKINGLDAVGSGNVINYGTSNINGTAGGGIGATGFGSDISYPEIAKDILIGDKVKILFSSGTHPTGNVKLNLDGEYIVQDVPNENNIKLTVPQSVNSDWNELFAISGGSAIYGPIGNGGVISTVTRVAT